MAQLKDLIVTGASRFLNIIHGSIDGNAASADKVNQSLSIKKPNGQIETFNGSVARTISLLPQDLQIAGVMRFVGDTTSTFGVDGVEDRYCVEKSDGNENIIRISKLYTSLVSLKSVTVGGTTVNNVYVPELGDVIRTEELELLCVGLDEPNISSGSTTYAKNSHWIVIGNNEIWHTY